MKPKNFSLCVELKFNLLKTFTPGRIQRNLKLIKIGNFTLLNSPIFFILLKNRRYFILQGALVASYYLRSIVGLAQYGFIDELDEWPTIDQYRTTGPGPASN